MTDVERVAFEVGAEAGGRYGTDPGEAVAVAWLGALEAPPGAATGLVATVARRRVIDERRREARSVRWLPRDRSVAPLSVLHDQDGEVSIPDRPPCRRSRLVELWGETRPQRAGWPLRLRVALYLYAVEGWEMSDISRAWGLTRSAASRWMAQMDPGGAFDACARLRRQGRPCGAT